LCGGAAGGAARAGDRRGQGHALFGLALSYARAGRFDEVPALLDQAWDLAAPAADQILRARICAVRGWMADRNDDMTSALRHIRRELDLFRASGFRPGEREALGDLGWCYTRLGEHERAIACCEEALAMPALPFRADVDAAVSDTLGYAHVQIGRHRDALSWYQRALDLHLGNGDRLNGGIVLTHIAECRQAVGDQSATRAAYQQALSLYEEIDHPDAAGIRIKLADLADFADLEAEVGEVLRLGVEQ
jgi:tetratricopeptide (TPR) repeat protein